jgi:hypothetical protein
MLSSYGVCVMRVVAPCATAVALGVPGVPAWPTVICAALSQFGVAPPYAIATEIRAVPPAPPDPPGNMWPLTPSAVTQRVHQPPR